MTRKYISFFPPADHPYDTLLDDYEPGMKTADVKAIFNALRPQQVELLKAIAGQPQVGRLLPAPEISTRRNSGISAWMSSPALVTTGTAAARTRPRTPSRQPSA
ncbi:MAG: hypothetical protein MZV63_07105 [Marinilabiliales bacterium]|nr:hypothetical protein [Marinilabiliales bacterium]